MCNTPAKGPNAAASRVQKCPSQRRFFSTILAVGAGHYLAGTKWRRSWIRMTFDTRWAAVASFLYMKQTPSVRGLKYKMLNSTRKDGRNLWFGLHLLCAVSFYHPPWATWFSIFASKKVRGPSKYGPVPSSSCLCWTCVSIGFRRIIPRFNKDTVCIFESHEREIDCHTLVVDCPPTDILFVYRSIWVRMRAHYGS